MNIQELAIQFESYQKQVFDRYKVIDVLLQQMVDRAEAEDRYSRYLEKICSQMSSAGGDMDDLLQSVKIDLHQRSQYNKQFTTQFKGDLEHAQNAQKVINTQYKPLCQDIIKIDREVKSNQEKLERARERYLKALKDYEEVAIAYQASMWNKECPADVRTKNLSRLQTSLQTRNDAEGQLKMASLYYNNSIILFNAQLQSSNKQMQAMFTQLFALGKVHYQILSPQDIIMKTLVYEISRLRNLQYDSEQFFKEIEKYEDPATIGSLQAIGSLGLIGAKEQYQKHNLNLNCTFLRPIADDIAIAHRLSVKRDSSDDDSLTRLTLDATFMTELKSLINNHIAESHGKPQQVNPLSAQDFVASWESKSEEVPRLLGFVDCVVNASADKPNESWKQLVKPVDLDEVKTLLERPLYVETFVSVLESFRTAGQFLFSEATYECLARMIEMALENTTDLHLIKRIILMMCTLYRQHGGPKLFIQEALLLLPIWQRLDLWDGLIYVAIEEEIDKSNTYTNREQLFKDKNTIFSNMFTISLNMMNFKVPKTDIKQLIQKNAKIYALYDIQTQELLSFVESDGKGDVNRNVNSISVLSSLYHGTEQQQKQSQPTVQQYVPKKVLIFEKKLPTQQTQQQQQQQSRPVSMIVQSDQADTQSPQFKSEVVSKNLEQMTVEQDPKKKAGFLKKLF